MSVVVGADMDMGEFFAPMRTDTIDALLANYREQRLLINQVGGIFGDSKLRSAVGYFLEGSCHEERPQSFNLDRIFDTEKAVSVLNANYWNKLLKMTDILDLMPQNRRSEWFEQIRKREVPEFEDQTVRDTLCDLLASRSKFFAERVDGIFRALSRNHVTNIPQGFSKRMILYYMVNSDGSTDTSRTGYINDLRAVIAKLQGRDEPNWHASYRLIQALQKRTGEWFDVDGGALRLRLYKKGTAHLEIHPNLAWQLNRILAYLHPAAIPSEFRAPPKKKHKEVRVMQRPLSYAVLGILNDIKRNNDHDEGYRYYVPYSSNLYAGARDQAIQILESIGGVRVPGINIMVFDYAIEQVVEEIIISGCVPDEKSHQFYPTPEKLARIAVALADIGPEHQCLEPQAGHGGLARLMPLDRTTCVEISGLHCEILKSKGLHVSKADFLAWEGKPGGFERIVMNPPFNLGRWQDHLDAAVKQLKPGGRLVAILPAGAKNRAVLPELDCTFHGPYENEFPGTSVDVVILVANKT
ncbi:hypothetical protein BVZ28_13875 [Alcaligenes faecalis]|uniref:DUF4942 domain-containing protein n=1 Tax=Alcaligenes faecalis TaxID=511 RepID=A0A1Z3ML30_ALCFA|nr:class I SAM-dependent methyltransferase [Alcaligenes faecalis]ASD48509.1 hypothetical protein [Alcaligenes faecalis]OSZ33093.1 hypothetical protein BVZ28_13875 [Alcaligenes faecalis]OSZ41197.1 hypothetical protein BVZ29_13570 [Alcaligenes faecalis]